MLTIQILILLFVIFALSRTFLKFREGKLSRGWLLLWLLFWISVGVVVLLPELASRLAALVGITRGSDLVVYLAVITLFYLVFRILVKIESLEQEITKVVRQAALDEDRGKE